MKSNRSMLAWALKGVAVLLLLLLLASAVILALGIRVELAPLRGPVELAASSPAVRFTALDQLALEDIELNYRDQQLNQELSLRPPWTTNRWRFRSRGRHQPS